MTQSLDWNDIRIFLEVTRAKRLSGAARRLGVSHTTVARHISQLEALLHNRLLELGEDGLTPTDAGAALIPIAEKMEARAGEVMDRLQLPGALTGRVRIGAPDGFGNAALSRMLPAIVTEEPNLDIELVPVPASHKLWNRDVDIAISLDRPTSGRLVIQKLTDYDLRLYATPEFLAAHLVPTRRNDLVGFPVVGYIDELLYTDELDFNRLVHPGLKTVYRAATVQAQLDAVTSGVGMGVLPCFMAAGTDLVPILPDLIGFTRAYWLLYGEEDREIARIQRVARFIREVTKARAAQFRFQGAVDAAGASAPTVT